MKRRVKVVPRPGREEALICIPVLLARWKAVRSPSPLPSSPFVPVRWMFCPYRPRLASIWGGDADARVSNPELGAAAGILQPNLDGGVRMGEFYGVANEVGDDGAGHLLVGVDL